MSSTVAEIYQKSLPCRITIEEKLEYADKAARAFQELKQAQNEAKDAAANYKAIVERHTAEQERFNLIISTGTDWRQIDCQREMDYEMGIVREVRLDTGEILTQRAMNEREKQMRMEFPDDEGATTEEHDDGKKKRAA